MLIEYSTNKVFKLCTDKKCAIKSLGFEVGVRLRKLIELLDSSSCLLDILEIPMYRLHALKGNRKNQYSIVIWFNSKYRLIIYPKDINDNILVNNGDELLLFKNTKKIKIMEVSKHYEWDKRNVSSR